MILGLRLLEHPNGKVTVQHLVADVLYDESGSPHICGPKEWQDVPMYSVGQWKYEPDGSVSVVPDEPGVVRSNVIG